MEQGLLLSIRMQYAYKHSTSFSTWRGDKIPARSTFICDDSHYESITRDLSALFTR